MSHPHPQSLQLAPGFWRIGLAAPPGQWCEGVVEADPIRCPIGLDQDVLAFAPQPLALRVEIPFGQHWRAAVDPLSPAVFWAQTLRLAGQSPRRAWAAANRWRAIGPLLMPAFAKAPRLWSGQTPKSFSANTAARLAEAFADPAIDLISFDAAPDLALPPPDPILLETADPWAPVRVRRPGAQLSPLEALKAGRWLHLPEALAPKPAYASPPPKASAPPQSDALLDVSVIIPTRDRADLLSACLKGLASTRPAPRQIVLVDHLTQDSAALDLMADAQAKGAILLQADGPFNFSRLANLGAQAASASVLCFLNNDVQALDPHWLQALAADALRPDIGAVGPLLTYPNGSIQHIGLAGDAAGSAEHLCLGWALDRQDPAGLIRTRRSVLAVSGACLATRADLFSALSGFDEGFPSDFNDVDYCLRARARGLATIINPTIRLQHDESATRRRLGGDHRVGALALALRHPLLNHPDPVQSPRLQRTPTTLRIRSLRPA
jgi:GT2 family glycosyltransferase